MAHRRLSYFGDSREIRSPQRAVMYSLITAYLASESLITEHADYNCIITFLDLKNEDFFKSMKATVVDIIKRLGSAAVECLCIHILPN